MSLMRITYVAQTRFPTEKAHGHQIAQVCSAMASLGLSAEASEGAKGDHDVVLLTPSVWTPITESPSEYYGVQENFRWERLSNLDAFNKWYIPEYFSFAIAMWSYRKHLRSYLADNPCDLLYCRSHAVLPPMLATGASVILELHTLPRHGRSEFVKLCNQCKKVVCLTSQMRDELVQWGVDEHQVIVEGDAVREEVLCDVLPVKDFAKRFGEHPVVGYVGSLVARNSLSKGVDVLIDALAVLKRQGKAVRGLIVGGPEDWKKKYKDHARKIGLSSDDAVFTGKVPSSNVSSMMSSCDVLVYPAPASNHPYYVRDTSPLKVFEYMASGRPIVAADIPPIRDILNEETATFFLPGDADSCAQAIQRVISNPEEAHQRTINARKRVEDYTWVKRMARILERVIS